MSLTPILKEFIEKEASHIAGSLSVHAGTASLIFSGAKAALEADLSRMKEFAEWKEKERYWCDWGGFLENLDTNVLYWSNESANAQNYTTDQLLEKFIEHINKK